MNVEEYKKIIIVQLDRMEEQDLRFLSQLHALIKRYIIEKRGR